MSSVEGARPSEDPQTSEPKPPEPQYVSVSQFDEFQRMVTGTLESIRSGFDAIAASRPAPPPAPDAPIDDIDVSDYQKAVEEGDGARAAALLKKAVAAAEARVERKLTKEKIEPLQSVGLNSIAELSVQAARGSMPLYDRFKDQVDKAVASMPPEMRLNPSNIKYAYDMIVGAHVDALRKEAAEEAVRKLRETGEPLTPTSTPGRGQGETKAPSVEEVAGAGAAAALAAVGRSPDELAKKLGFENWMEYAKTFPGGAA